MRRPRPPGGSVDLIGGDGKSYPHREPIPGVYVPAGEAGPGETLRRLFPRSHYPALWERHPHAFEAAP